MYTKCKKSKYFHSNRTNFLQISDYLQATDKVSVGVTMYVGIVLAVTGEVEDRNMSNDYALNYLRSFIFTTFYFICILSVLHLLCCVV